MQRGKEVTLETKSNLGFEPDLAQLQSSQQASCGRAAPTRAAVPTPQDGLPCGDPRVWKALGLGTGDPSPTAHCHSPRSSWRSRQRGTLPQLECVLSRLRPDKE